MTLKQGSASEQSETRQGCCHYWVIEVANGGTSEGICRFCGEQRLFDNHLHVFGDEGGEDVEEWNDHIPAPKPTLPKGGQTDSDKGVGATRNEYTRADFKRWGAMGGRGNKRKG